jgi:NAD(P)-dependent dehydrogenase (short-subunit alcohol dehydrogenase family)
MDLELGGNVAVVVGAAQGLGHAIASAFASEGAVVALLDRAPETPDVARRLSGSTGARAEGFVADVTDYAAVRGVAESVRARFGRCDHVVFAAAVGSGKFGFPFWNLDPADWDRVLRVNLVGAAHVAHAFAPAMAEVGSGTLLFLASVAGQIGSQTDPPYSASKAALINFAQCAAKDLAPRGVRVNALCPGMVQTALNRSTWAAWNERQPESERLSYDDWAASKIRQLVPLNRWQEPDDIAAMAVFLASPRAKNVTGQTINVDGGYVMHW